MFFRNCLKLSLFITMLIIHITQLFLSHICNFITVLSRILNKNIVLREEGNMTYQRWAVTRRSGGMLTHEILKNSFPKLWAKKTLIFSWRWLNQLPLVCFWKAWVTAHCQQFLSEELKWNFKENQNLPANLS